MADHTTRHRRGEVPHPIRDSSRLLIDESPLQVIPSLAVAIGLEQAVIIQQIHYLTRSGRNVRDGRSWVYKTYDEWHEEFPFIAVRSLKRIFPQLEAAGLLLVANYNDHKIDRTKWYSINYDHPILVAATPSVPLGQSGTTIVPNWPNALGQTGTIHSAKVDKSVPKIVKDQQEEDDDHFIRRMARKYPDAQALAPAYTTDGVLDRARYLAALSLATRPRGRGQG